MSAKVLDTLKEARRIRLKQLRDERFEGSNTKLGRALGKQPDYISRAILGHKAVGEGMARDVEQKLDLPVRWLDGDQIAEIAQQRVFLEADVMLRCMNATSRWELVDNATLPPLRRTELVCTLYEMFHDRPETTEDQMVAFLKRQTRLATRIDVGETTHTE